MLPDRAMWNLEKKTKKKNLWGCIKWLVAHISCIHFCLLLSLLPAFAQKVLSALLTFPHNWFSFSFYFRPKHCFISPAARHQRLLFYLQKKSKFVFWQDSAAQCERSKMKNPPFFKKKAIFPRTIKRNWCIESFMMRFAHGQTSTSDWFLS